MNNLDLSSKRFLIILIIILLLFFMIIVVAFDFLNKHADEDSFTQQDNYSETIGFSEKQEPVQESRNDVPEEETHHVSFETTPEEQNENYNNRTSTVEENGIVPINESENKEDSTLSVTQNSEMLFAEAQKLKNEKQYVKALEEYKSILDKNINNETNAKCYEEMANIYAVVKRYGSALSYAQKAYSTSPSSARELLIARIYYKTGDVDKATKKINNILQRDFSADN